MKQRIILAKVIIILQLTSVMPKKRTKDDSFETIVYFRDSREDKQPVIQPFNLEGARSDTEYESEEINTTPTPKQFFNECKMCFSTCCGPDCQCSEQQNTTPQRPTATEPSARRGFSTRDYIKNVLTHDVDISAILKNLVAITLQKVDMMKKMDNINGESEF